MANTVIVVDNTDEKLGAFFQICIDDLDNFFKQTAIQPIMLYSHNLNDLSVQLTTQPLKTFVFAAYSHGSDTSLLKSNSPYISTTLNNTCFHEAFFYTFSCKSGHELGSNLVENGCLCYIGYKRTVSIWDGFVQPFVICANHGLKLFFNGLSTSNILVEMKAQYNIEIDSFYQKDYMISSILRENRDALVLHGNDINITHL